MSTIEELRAEVEALKSKLKEKDERETTEVIISASRFYIM